MANENEIIEELTQDENLTESTNTPAAEETTAETESGEKLPQTPGTRINNQSLSNALNSGKHRKARRIPIDARNVRAQTSKDIEAKDRELLIESLKHEYTMTGTLDGVERINGQNTVLGVVYLDNIWKIVIPADQLFNMPTDFPTEEEAARFAEHSLSLRLGSEIDFIICHIDEDTHLAIASRIKAMTKKKKRYYLAKRRDANHKPVEAGEVVEARVVTVTRAAIMVEAHGVECRIPARDLSWHRIQDCTLHFSCGQFIWCMVKTIKRNVQTATVELTLSHKDTIPDPYLDACAQLQVGSTYIGTITMVTEHGVFAKLPIGIDVLCKHPERGRRPEREYTAKIKITKILPEERRVFGIITTVLGMSKAN